MPRKSRMYLAGFPYHVIQRGNDRKACFFAEVDYQGYLSLLGNACRRYKVALNAYVLMTNHAHLILTPENESGVSQVMQSLGRCYVQRINKKYSRTGTLWESRHKSNPIDADNYLLACYRYVEQNPVRATMVQHAADYRWSSYRAHAYGELNRFLSDHEVFVSLHTEPIERQKIYREMFNTELSGDLLEKIRSAAGFSMPLGNSSFKTKIENMLNRKLGHSKRGRPKKVGR